MNEVSIQFGQCIELGRSSGLIYPLYKLYWVAVLIWEGTTVITFGQDGRKVVLALAACEVVAPGG